MTFKEKQKEIQRLHREAEQRGDSDLMRAMEERRRLLPLFQTLETSISEYCRLMRLQIDEAKAQQLTYAVANILRGKRTPDIIAALSVILQQAISEILESVDRSIEKKLDRNGKKTHGPLRRN